MRSSSIRRGRFIDDDEIRAVILRPEEFDRIPEDSNRLYGRTPFMRAVVHQVGTRGCAAACSAMMCLDHRITPDWQWVQDCDITFDCTLIAELRKKGFEVKHHCISSNVSDAGEELERLLRMYYAGIFSVKSDSHFMMLDYFSRHSNLAIIRDPFHGWCVATSVTSLLHRRPDYFIGVTLPKEEKLGDVQ